MSDKGRKPNLFFRMQEYAGLALFFLMCLLMILQLLSRYVFASPLLFTEEFSRLAYLGYWGVEYMIFNQWNVAASVDFPLFWVYAALPVGCALSIVNIVCNSFTLLTGSDRQFAWRETEPAAKQTTRSPRERVVCCIAPHLPELCLSLPAGPKRALRAVLLLD